MVSNINKPLVIVAPPPTGVPPVGTLPPFGCGGDWADKALIERKKMRNIASLKIFFIYQIFWVAGFIAWVYEAI